MRCLKGRITVYLILIANVLPWATGRKINATIHGTNLAHVTYAPAEDYCARWVSSWMFWKTCEMWMRPWKSEVCRDQGKSSTVHRSLDHQLPSVTVEFQGLAVWIYGPPRSQLAAIPGDYKICLQENHRLSYNSVCYRVNVTEAYSATKEFSSPVVIFAKGGLQYHEHRVMISVADPADNYDTQNYRGIQFSHAVYTVERPTPWPVEEDWWRFREAIMHDTHPLLTYSPLGWTAKTYKTKDGSAVSKSWSELRSRGNQDRNQLGVDTTITAGAVALYGIPKVHISDTSDLSQICVRINSGPCEVVDVQNAYLNVEDPHESVMVWRNDALDPSEKTRVSIRLVLTSSSSGGSVFPFEAIHYYEKQEYSSPNPAGRLVDFTINHDDSDVVYEPKYNRRGRMRWVDPWTRKLGGPSANIVSYASTEAQYRKTEDPNLTLNFQGRVVHVYGAPKSFIQAPYAPQHVCIDDVCHVIDLQQAYLNAPMDGYESAGTHTPSDYGANSDKGNNKGSASALHNATTMSPPHPELEPVLIWSMSGLDDLVQHTLRLALAALPSADLAEMTFIKVVYSKVYYNWGQQRPEIPGYEPDHAYEGPLHPPHGTKWTLQVPPSHPPEPEPPKTGTAVLRLAFSVLVLSIIFFYSFYSSGRIRSSPEQQPILSPSPNSQNIADVPTSYGSVASTH